MTKAELVEVTQSLIETYAVEGVGLENNKPLSQFIVDGLLKVGLRPPVTGDLLSQIKACYNKFEDEE